MFSLGCLKGEPTVFQLKLLPRDYVSQMCNEWRAGRLFLDQHNPTTAGWCYPGTGVIGPATPDRVYEWRSSWSFVRDGEHAFAPGYNPFFMACLTMSCDRVMREWSYFADGWIS